jgi:hypothetical protein
VIDALAARVPICVINPMLFEHARDGALPGKEAVTVNEALRALIESLRQPPLIERLVVTATVVVLRRG